ncbi:beta-ketoacyl synthase chain length factor [Ancylomarina sp. YFZ004]
MAIYIKASSMVSAQETLQATSWPKTTVSAENSSLQIIPPAYKDFIPAAKLRRMNRLVKFSLVSAFDCMSQVEGLSLDAIITTTGLGCIDDTGVFLKQMHENGEKLMNPTAFIRSTHNAVGGQLALLKNLRIPNLTYTQKEVSFEAGLIDAIMMLEEGDAKNVLLGGFDEHTPLSLDLWKQMGCLSESVLDKSTLMQSQNKGIVLGEGAGFVVLSSEEEASNCSQLIDVEIHRSVSTDLNCLVQAFLAKQGLSCQDIDLLVLGLDGTAHTKDLAQLMRSDFEAATVAGFKHLSGCFDTDTSFALWMAHRAILNAGIGEEACLQGEKDRAFNKVLIVNASQANSYSFIVVSSC